MAGQAGETGAVRQAGRSAPVPPAYGSALRGSGGWGHERRGTPGRSNQAIGVIGIRSSVERGGKPRRLALKILPWTALD